MNGKLSILILDDDTVYRKLADTILKQEFTVFSASTPSQAFEILKNTPIDILICDFRLPEMDGLEVVKKIKPAYPDLEIIMISSHANTDTVIEALRLGAVDFFKKPFNFEDVKISIEKTKKFVTINNRLRHVELSNSALTRELKEKNGFEIISQSPVMQEIKNIMYKVAQTYDTSVIITGESGTGKELIARGIHNMSSRKDNYFGAINTSAIPESLFESEFFGHKKGAFTGAIGDRGGWFEIADKGTLFLDEIGEMPGNQQIKLLRVLEDRKFIKVGSQKEQSFDIRILAATNRKIEDLKSGKDFRLDLFHRLGTFEIYLPPLRERKEDIPLLLNHFARLFAKRMKKNIEEISQSCEQALINYPFPGNIRELRNLTERAVILSDGPILSLDHFPNIIQEDKVPSSFSSVEEIFDLELLEKRTIIKALEKTGYNKSQTAKLLNINWNALHRRLQKFDIDIPNN